MNTLEPVKQNCQRYYVMHDIAKKYKLTGYGIDGFVVYVNDHLDILTLISPVVFLQKFVKSGITLGISYDFGS